MSAPVINETQLGYLRTDNQWSELFAYIHKPRVVFSARVASVPSSYDQVTKINFSSPNGNVSDILEDMTCWVGSAAGKNDLGMVRVRSSTANQLSIGETSELVWEVGQYLTVIEDFDLWAVKLGFQGGVWNIEGEVKYTGQNKDKKPVPVLGPSFGVKQLTGSMVSFQFDASHSWVPGSSVTGYSSSFVGPVGATITVSGETTSTPTATVDMPGLYRWSCTVTAANGKTSTGHRFLWIWDDDEVYPVTQFTPGTITTDYESGDSYFSVTMLAEADISDVQDRAQIVLFTKDHFGNTQVNMGPVPGYENIVAIGRIEGDSIDWNPEMSTVQFKAHSPAWWAANTASWPISVMDTQSEPADWMHIQGLTVDSGLWHLVAWRSTWSVFADVYPSGDTRRSFDCSGNIGNLWEQLLAMTDQKIGAHPCCDRYGRLFVEVDPQLVPVSDRSTVPVVMDITKDDWSDKIQVDRRNYQVTALLETGGFQWDGSKWNPMLSRSAGNAMRRTGGYKSRNNLLFSSQDQANELTGLLAAKDNNPYPSIPVTLAMNNRLLDVVPRRFLTISLAAEDTPRGLVWNGFRVIPRRVELVWMDSPTPSANPGTVEGRMHGFYTRIELEGETSGPSGVTVNPPAAVSVNTIDPDPGDGAANGPGTNTWFPPYSPPDPEDCASFSQPPSNYAGTYAPEVDPDDHHIYYLFFPCVVRSSSMIYPTYLTVDSEVVQSVSAIDGSKAEIVAAHLGGTMPGWQFSPGTPQSVKGFKVVLTTIPGSSINIGPYSEYIESYQTEPYVSPSPFVSASDTRIVMTFPSEPKQRFGGVKIVPAGTIHVSEGQTFQVGFRVTSFQNYGGGTTTINYAIYIYYTDNTQDGAVVTNIPVDGVYHTLTATVSVDNSGKVIDHLEAYVVCNSQSTVDTQMLLPDLNSTAQIALTAVGIFNVCKS